MKNKKVERNYFIYILYFVAVLVLVLQMRTDLWDDSATIGMLDQFSKVTDWVVHRYNTWSARFLQETIGYFVVPRPELWKIVEIAVIYSIPFLFTKILGWKMDDFPIAILGFVLFPITTMASAGWMCTSMTYLWPVCFAMVYFMFLYKYMHNEKLPVWSYGVIYVALIVACNHELMAAFMAVVILYSIVEFIIKNKRPPYLLGINFFICVANIIFILTAPGNSARTESETAARFPDFASFTFGQKMYMGLVRVYSVLVEEHNIVFIVLCIMLAVASFLILDKAYKKIIGFIPAFLLLLMNTIVEFYRLGCITVVDLTQKGAFIPVVLSAIFVICMILTFYFLLWEKDKYKMGLLSVCLLIGIATEGVMGFSPTIYASAERTCCFMLFAFIYIILVLIDMIMQCDNIMPEGKTQFRKVLYFVTVVLYLLNVLSIYLIHHSQYGIIR